MPIFRLKPISETMQCDFFNAMLDLYHRAESKRGAIRYDFMLANTHVCLQFASERLAEIMAPAFAHHHRPVSANPDFTVCLWDSASSGVDMIPPPCNPKFFTNNGGVWGFNSPRYKFAYHYGEFSINVMDREAGIAVYWVRDAVTLPFWAHASPLRSLLHLWMQQNNKQLIHGAAIGNQNGAVLLAGKGGMGKSSTALSCLLLGMDYLGDDYVIIDLNSIPLIHSLYNTAKLDPQRLYHYPELQADATSHTSLGYEKTVMYLHEKFAGKIKDSLPVKGILLPVVEDKTNTSVTEAEVMTVEQAIRFTTLSHLPYTGSKSMAMIAQLVSQIPHGQLRLGRDRQDVTDCITDYLSQCNSTLSKENTRIAHEYFSLEEWPLISVIIPVYNGARFIEEVTINIINQHYPRTEIIFVNDGSTDNSKFQILNLPYDVSYYESKTNQGPAETRNRGIREATGDYLAFLDVDDLWPDNSLIAHMRRFQQNHRLDITRGIAQLMMFNPITGNFENKGDPNECFPHYIGAGLYRKEVFLRVGPFDSGLRFGEDSDWYHRAEELAIQIEVRQEVSLYVRRHEQNMTTGKNQLELNRVRILKNRIDRTRQRNATL